MKEKHDVLYRDLRFWLVIASLVLLVLFSTQNALP
jgi:hypothetical protein